MLFLGVSLSAALIFSTPIPAVPVSSGAPNPAAAALNRNQSSSQPIKSQRRLDSGGALVSFNEALSPSGSSASLPLKNDHEVECFKPSSILPNAKSEDCNIIINTIIVGMKDPFVEQSWGYTDDEDINLSLSKYRWVFKDCLIQVKNIDEDQVDRFRPVDVAEMAQRIVQACVFGTKSPLGGTGDVGHLELPRTFYVVVSGSTSPVGQSLRNSTVLSLPSDGSRTIESRASLIPPQEKTTPSAPTQGLNADEEYPVRCFDPGLVHRLRHAVASDCALIVNELILRLPNPMREQTFGYTDADDVNLSDREHSQWVHGQCVVFIKGLQETAQDRFRYIDVAHTTIRITEKCVERSKYAIGGTAAIGTMENTFYIGVGGVTSNGLGNGTVLGLSAPLQAIPEISSSHRPSDAKSANLGKRSNNTTELIQTTSDFAPPVTCLEPGAPTARKIDFQDCTNAALHLLSNPEVLLPQAFTTEATGGIQMPFIQHYGSCYLTMDTKSKLSISVSIPLLKVVYWASEIMLKCVGGRVLGVGGESRLDNDKEIVVSVTGVNPTSVENRLASFLQ